MSKDELYLLDIAFVEQQIKGQIKAVKSMRKDAFQFDDPVQMSLNVAYHDGSLDVLEKLLDFLQEYIEIRKGENK